MYTHGIPNITLIARALRARQPARFYYSSTSITGTRSQILRQARARAAQGYTVASTNGLFQFVTARPARARDLPGIVAAIEDALEYLTPVDRAAVLPLHTKPTKQPYYHQTP